MKLDHFFGCVFVGDFIDLFYHGIHLVFFISEWIFESWWHCRLLGNNQLLNPMVGNSCIGKYFWLVFPNPPIYFFPKSGVALLLISKDVVARHSSKVYGKAAIGAPPMSATWLQQRPHGMMKMGNLDSTLGCVYSVIVYFLPGDSSPFFHHYLGNTFHFCPTTQLTQIQVINLFKTLPLLRRVHPIFQLIRWIFHVDPLPRTKFATHPAGPRYFLFCPGFFHKKCHPQKTNSPVSAPGWCSYYDRVLRWHWFSRGGHDHTTDTNTLESNEAIGFFCYELPKTNGKRPWKMVVGTWNT